MVFVLLWIFPGHYSKFLWISVDIKCLWVGFCEILIFVSFFIVLFPKKFKKCRQIEKNSILLQKVGKILHGKLLST
jgi:hypothetical protein